MAWHNEGPDPFYTSEAGARAAYYVIAVNPTCVFDGTTQIMGGSSSTYSQYMNVFNTRRGVSSPLTIAFLARSYSGNHASVKVQIKLEQGISSGHVCHIVLWEDKCHYNSEEYRFVQRRQASPTTITISGVGQEQTIKAEFTLGAAWTRANLGVSAFVQNPASKAVLNGRATKLVEGNAIEPTSLGRVKALFY